MKSIKNQYIALKEGKMTEAQFMRNVRMTLPEYISNVTLFKQAERILMNKGIISEIKVNEASSQVGLTKANQDKISDLTPEQKKKLGDDLTDAVADVNDKEFKTKAEYAKAMKSAKATVYKKYKITEAKDDSATGYYNQDGKEQYSKFNEEDNMNAQEIMAGYVMEKQDNPDLDQKEAVKLVIKNLKKDQFYYTNYKLTGVPGLKPTEFTTTKRKPFFDQMEEVDKKGTNFVDEKNKMVVVKEGLEIQEAEQDLEAIADEVYAELQSMGSYTSSDVNKLIDTYPNLSSEDKMEIGVNIFDRDREELDEQPVESDYNEADFDEDTMDESSMQQSQKYKLKEMVRKMMKEMFDGRDNVTDVTGENV